MATPSPSPANQKKQYAPIPPLVPEDASPEAIAQTQKSLDDRINNQIGTFVRYQKDNLPNPRTWEIRNVDGNEVQMRFDPRNPDHVTYWDPNTGESSVPLGGEEYYNEVQALRRELSGIGENPLTRQPWSPDILSANYGQLRANQRMVQRSKDLTAPSTSDTTALTTANQTVGLLKDIEDQYQAAGGKAGLNKFNQIVQNFTTGTDIGNWQGKDSQRIAYLKFMRDLANLGQNGVQVGKLSQDGASKAIGDTISNVFLQGGVFHPLLGVAGAGVTKLAQAALSGQFDPDAIRAMVPLARAQLDRQIYDQVSNLTGPQGTSLQENFREYGRKAQKDLENIQLPNGEKGIGPDEDPAQKLGLINEPVPGETPAATPAATPAGIPSAAGQPTPKPSPKAPIADGLDSLRPADISTQVPPKNQDPLAQIKELGDWANRTFLGAPPKAPIGPNAAPASDIKPIERESIISGLPPNRQPIPTPRPTPTPSVIPDNRGIIMKGADWLRQHANPNAIPNTIMPFSENDSGQQIGANIADNLPSVTSQDHLDSLGLEPGTPFKWHDGETYVKT